MMDNGNKNKQEIFDILLDLMIEFKRVCDKYHFNYSLHCGTLLGAIRHDGFIPWDDDVDIMMPREDYDKLKEIATSNVFQDPYFLQTPDTDPGSTRMFMRLRNSNTTSISNTDILYKMNQGIFIDIFPIDAFPKNIIKQKFMITKLGLITKIAGGYSRYYSKLGIKSNDSKSVRLMYYLLYPLFKLNIINSRKLFHRFEKIATSYRNKDCSEIIDTVWMIYDYSYHFPKRYVEDGYMNKNFEGIEFKVLNDYDAFLTAMYGDYMTPVKEPTGHGELVQITNIGYEQFIKDHYKELIKNW